MKEHNYTIPINEHFDKGDGCALCSLYEMLENNEVDIIMGAAVMEPDIRLKTDAQGFCRHHYSMMFNLRHKLPLGLLLSTHLAAAEKKAFKAAKTIGGGYDSKKLSESLLRGEHSCYICNRVAAYFDSVLGTIAMLWEKEEKFRVKTQERKYFCLPHFNMLLKKAGSELRKKNYKNFEKALCDKQNEYMQSLVEDTVWFTKKFDYKNADADWGNSRDAVPRAINFLHGDEGQLTISN